MSDKAFILWGATNYIDFEEVLPAEDTLQQTRIGLLDVKIDLDEPHLLNIYLDEFRTELEDDNINFMSLSETKQIDYLNFHDVVREWPFTYG